MKFFLFILGGILGLAVALGISEAFHLTSSDKFCGTFCHIMEPMRDAYLDDIHGGKNGVGFKAECVSCHLPHDNMAKYVLQKSYNGVKEFALNAFDDPENYDWQGKRKHKKDFVYDSGCMSCHGNIQNATNSNMKSFLPHRDYFAGTSQKTCVECHENVGHKNLGFHLDKKFAKSTK